jgi:hypothetical protein
MARPILTACRRLAVIRHLIRQVVKFGHVDDFLAASKALNDAAKPIGMPPYRVYQSNWGTFNEMFSEAEYESSAEMDRVMAALMKEPAVDKAFREYISHLVDGEAHDYVLEERHLG